MHFKTQSICRNADLLVMLTCYDPKGPGGHTEKQKPFDCCPNQHSTEWPELITIRHTFWKNDGTSAYLDSIRERLLAWHFFSIIRSDWPWWWLEIVCSYTNSTYTPLLLIGWKNRKPKSMPSKYWVFTRSQTRELFHAMKRLLLVSFRQKSTNLLTW